MAPKEKAEELFKKFAMYSRAILEDDWEAKQCALIAVDEIINAIDWHKFDVPNDEFEYWEEVKQEIENL